MSPRNDVGTPIDALSLIDPSVVFVATEFTDASILGSC